MIIGIGTDIIKIERIKKACEREAFLRHVYTEKEKEICKSPAMFAGNFAVKEAVSKTFGTGLAFKVNEIEVLRDEKGKPYVELYGKAKEIAKEKAIKSIYVSISDEDDVAVAFAVAEG